MPPTPQIALRLPQGLIDRLDAEAARLSEGRIGAPVTRTDIVRMALQAYFAAKDAAVPDAQA